MYNCKQCGKPIKSTYRFTDWDNPENDVFGDYETCLALFLKSKSQFRSSIYNVDSCEYCGFENDEGILFSDCYYYEE